MLQSYLSQRVLDNDHMKFKGVLSKDNAVASKHKESWTAHGHNTITSSAMSLRGTRNDELHCSLFFVQGEALLVVLFLFSVAVGRSGPGMKTTQQLLLRIIFGSVQVGVVTNAKQRFAICPTGMLSFPPRMLKKFRHYAVLRS